MVGQIVVYWGTALVCVAVTLDSHVAAPFEQYTSVFVVVEYLTDVVGNSGIRGMSEVMGPAVAVMGQIVVEIAMVSVTV